MKKKIAWIVSLLLCLCTCFGLLAGCDKKEQKSLYEQLNDYAGKTYSTVVLNLSVTKQGGIDDTLIGKYTAKKTADGYSVEFEYTKYNLIFAGESGGLQESTQTCKGTAVYRNGELAESTGDKLNYSVSTSLSIRFDESNLSDQQKSDGKLSAKVKNPSAFLQSEVTYTNVFFTAEYNGNGLTAFELHYTDGSANVDAYYKLTA